MREANIRSLSALPSVRTALVPFSSEVRRDLKTSDEDNFHKFLLAGSRNSTCGFSTGSRTTELPEVRHHEMRKRHFGARVVSAVAAGERPVRMLQHLR